MLKIKLIFYIEIFTSSISYTLGHHFTFINPHITDTGYGAYGLLGPIALRLVPFADMKKASIGKWITQFVARYPWDSDETSALQ